MSISVVPNTALPGSLAAGNASGGVATLDPAAIDFASLLAGQLGDLGQGVITNTGLIGITAEAQGLLARSGGKPADDPLLAAAGTETDLTATPLAAMSVFEMLVPRSTAQKAAAAGDELAVAGERGGSKLLGLGNDKAGGNPALLASRLSASDVLAGNADAANLAGKLETGTTNPLAFNPATGSERTLISGRNEMQQTVPAPINDPRWAQQFGERVVWLARGDIQNAQINISPAQLGPIQINISLNGDQMTAHFVAAHQEVRQALEDAMPRLREMLSGAGINLGQSNVGSQAQQQQQAQQESSQQAGSAPRSAGEEAILSPDQQTHSATSGLPTQHGRGLVDLFA